jgi:hypothetical protein
MKASVDFKTDMIKIRPVPRKRSQRVSETKSKILTRIREGYYRPGDRFLSNRAVARTFGISFQTAQRLITELSEEGWVQQRASSGTYIAGSKINLEGVQLLVSQRTLSLKGVFSRLFRYLTDQLNQENIAWSNDWIGKEPAIKNGCFPVFCDCPALASVAANRNYALLLDDTPPPGLEATYIDSIAADDFSGGACAAQLFLQKKPAAGRYVVLGGPLNEIKSVQRVAGFRSIIPQAKLVSAGSWFFEDGMKVAGQVIRPGLSGVFCCNDLLAKALIVHCRQKNLPFPPLIGFDNDPIAEELNLTTIEIPEHRMVDDAVAIIRRRLEGDTAPASRQIFSCRPIVRASVGF